MDMWLAGGKVGTRVKAKAQKSSITHRASWHPRQVLECLAVGHFVRVFDSAGGLGRQAEIMTEDLKRAADVLRRHGFSQRDVLNGLMRAAARLTDERAKQAVRTFRGGG